MSFFNGRITVALPLFFEKHFRKAWPPKGKIDPMTLESPYSDLYFRRYIWCGR